MNYCEMSYACTQQAKKGSQVWIQRAYKKDTQMLISYVISLAHGLVILLIQVYQSTMFYTSDNYVLNKISLLLLLVLTQS